MTDKQYDALKQACGGNLARAIRELREDGCPVRLCRLPIGPGLPVATYGDMVLIGGDAPVLLIGVDLRRVRRNETAFLAPRGEQEASKSLRAWARLEPFEERWAW